MLRQWCIAVAAMLLQCCTFAVPGRDAEQLQAQPALVAVHATGQVVATVALDSAWFGESVGREGLWQPLRFVREQRTGVFLLQAYAPEKIPVLFVHGVGATPRVWRYFIERLDATAYQPWVYQYPTGAPIEISAQWLSDELTALHSRYRFRQLIVVGHSMGGLVARRFIALNTEETRVRYALVTFATPWAGHPLAGLGAAALGRYAIPSWKDLAPSSPLLTALQSEPLPPTAPHHLFFAYLDRGDTTDSDGIISVSSQLEAHIQAQATGVYGFRARHGAIIEDSAVFDSFATVLSVVAGANGRNRI